MTNVLLAPQGVLLASQRVLLAPRQQRMRSVGAPPTGAISN